MNDIIHDRNTQNTCDDNKNDNENKTITIKSLSSSIINKISSYLKLNEIIQFELTNRRHFVSVRYPYPALNCIGFGDGYNDKYNDLNWIQDYCQSTYDTNFNRFRCVNHLRFDIKDYMKYNISKYGLIFNKINKFSLFGFGETGNGLSLNTMFNTIQNGIKLNKLQHLTLTNFKISCLESSDIETFIKLIMCSSELKSLSLCDIYGHGNDDSIQLQFDENIGAKLPYLTAVNYYRCDSNIYATFAELISCQIKSLHIDDISVINNFFNKYSKLCEFCVADSMINISTGINKLIKYAKQIKNINMKIIESVENSLLEQKEFQNTLKIVMDIEWLQLLEITCFSTRTTGIVLDGLNSVNINNKNIFKIVINTAHKYYSCKYEQNINYDNKIKDLILKFETCIKRFVLVFITATGTGLTDDAIDFLKQKVNVNICQLTDNYPKATKLIISSHGDIYIPFIYTCDRHFEYTATNS
eukprot:133941_1